MSGLFGNTKKSEVFIVGVGSLVHQGIIEHLVMPMGVLPFKYLGVPLSHKKLSVSQCMPLLEKLSSRVKH